MLTTTTHISRMALIRRRRTLPVDGIVLVRAGQKVAPTDVIAQAELNRQHLALDIATGLGVPPEKAARHIQRKVGDEVSEGAIIASRGGMATRVVRAPHQGRVVSIRNGKVLLEVSNQPYLLKAGLPGKVVETIPDRGAVIGASGAWVQGVWGNGRVNYGVLHVLAEEAGHEFQAYELDMSLRGMVMLAGHCGDPEVLEKAAEVQVRGLILGSMDSKLIPVAKGMPYPVVVVEGFGQMSLSARAHMILKDNQAREVAVNAEKWDRFAGHRPEVIVPLPATDSISEPREAAQLAPRQRVRVVCAPHGGETGVIIELMPELVSFSSGLRARAADIRLDGGGSALIPLANLEVVD